MFWLFPSFVDISFCICAACWAEFQWDGMYSFSEDNEIRSWVPDHTDAWGLAVQTQVCWYGNASEAGTPIVQAVEAISKCDRKDNPTQVASKIMFFYQWNHLAIAEWWLQDGVSVRHAWANGRCLSNTFSKEVLIAVHI